MKKCIKCGIVKDESEFHKHKATKDGYRSKCKKCRKIIEIKEVLPEGVKRCSKCQIIKDNAEFQIKRRQCNSCLRELKKERYIKNKEKIREKKKEWNKQNADRIKQKSKIYYIKNRERILKNARDYFEKNKDTIHEKSKSYRKRHADELSKKAKHFRKENPDIFKARYQKRKEKTSAYHKLYLKSDNGKIATLRKNTKRRKLGYNPINKRFNGSNYHHFRYESGGGELDNNIGIYIPKELHESIRHNGITGENMDLINKEALKWYFDTTEEDQINPIAVSLYNKLTL